MHFDSSVSAPFCAVEETISQDQMNDEDLEAVHRFFPFTQAEESESFKVPNWAKQLLFEKYTLSNVKMIIKHFNVGGDQREEAAQPHVSRVSNLIIDDIDLTAVTVHQYNDMKAHWSQTGTNTEALTVLVPDYFDLVPLAPTDVQPDRSTSKQFTVEVDPSMTIGLLKRIILLILDNRPFFLEVDLSNNLTVANLLEASKYCQNEVKVFVNLDVFTLQMTHKDQNPGSAIQVEGI